MCDEKAMHLDYKAFRNYNTNGTANMHEVKKVFGLQKIQVGMYRLSWGSPVLIPPLTFNNVCYC